MFRRGKPGRRSPRVTFRVSLRSNNPKNGREPPKESDEIRRRHTAGQAAFIEESPYSLGLRAAREKTPCLLQAALAAHPDAVCRPERPALQPAGLKGLHYVEPGLTVLSAR